MRFFKTLILAGKLNLCNGKHKIFKVCSLLWKERIFPLRFYKADFKIRQFGISSPSPAPPKLANAQRRVCTYTDFLSHNSYSVGHGAMQSTQIDSEVYKFPEIMHKIYWYVCTCILMMSWTSWKFKIYQQTMLGNSESIFSRMDYSVAAIIIEKGYIIVNLILCVWQPQLIVTDSHIVSDHLHMKLGLYFMLDSIWLDGKGVFLNLNSWYLLFFTALFHKLSKEIFKGKYVW